MRFSYRLTSVLVIAIYVIWAASEALLNSSPTRVLKENLETGVIQFDSCLMWEQIPAAVRISNLLWFGSLLALLVQGMRNRSAPRWLAIACLMALIRQ